MILYIKITDIVYEVTGDIPQNYGPELKEYLFMDEPEGKHKIHVLLKAVREFSPLSAVPIYQSDSYIILKSDPNSNWLEPEHRVFMSKYSANPAACYIELKNLEEVMKGGSLDSEGAASDSVTSDHQTPDILIEYIPRENPVFDMTFMEFFSIDRALMCEDAFIMHSCFIEHEGKAIIFTAPSGTGKTTQGNLWTKYTDAHVINGDRCILKLNDDQTCMAYSLPFCGSSSINHHLTYPVKAVVFLSQGPENLIDARPSMYLLKKLMSQTTFSAWAHEATIKVLELYSSFMESTAFIQYACRPDEDAVKVLMNYLADLNPDT